MARIGFLLDRMDERSGVSPFFAKARWLLVYDVPAVTAVWTMNVGGSGEGLCSRIVDQGAQVLVCGWIDAASLRRLSAQGVDVRIAPCTTPALSWVLRHAQLPRPSPTPHLRLVK